MNEHHSSKFDSLTEPGPGNVRLIYFLYLLYFVLIFSGLFGLVFAYVNRNKSAPWVESHYTFQIRTFWIGLAFGIIANIPASETWSSTLTTAVYFWLVTRCVAGLVCLKREQPVPNPKSWIV